MGIDARLQRAPDEVLGEVGDPKIFPALQGVRSRARACWSTPTFGLSGT